MTIVVRALDGRGIEALAQIVASDPVRHTYAASRLTASRRGLLSRGYQDLVGAFDGDRLLGGLVLGANLVPVWPDESLAATFVPLLRRQGRRCSSIVGPTAQVNALWRLLEPIWGTARAVRAHQPVMAMQEYPRVEIDSQVRYARTSDIDVLLPACVDMFTGEVGISPVAQGGGPAYRARLMDLIGQRRSLIRTDNRGVLFKAELGVVSAHVGQVQGVWVRPDMRGRGIAVPAMAAVVRKVLDDIAATCSLYVNDFNAPALATYRAVGFEQVDEFATVLF